MELFFSLPEACALIVAFIGLLALDIKNRTWSILMFVGSLFLVFISGTRSIWLTFPLVVGLRYLFTTSKVYGVVFLFTLMSVVSFTTLSLPPLSELILDTYGNTVRSTAEARGDSTEVRQKIYTRTLEQIPDNLLLGHWMPGPTVLPGFELGRVGTHSFILGTLLYRAGLFGTGIFTAFWVSSYFWFYKTRHGRPLSCYGLLILFTLLSPVMEFGDIRLWMLFLLAAAMRSPQEIVT